MSEPGNRRVVLACRPDGAPEASNFTLVEQPKPRIGVRQILLRTLWLSLDPYMRGRMSTAPSYVAGIELGDVMVGGTVSQVVASDLADFQPGDLVLSTNGWQDYALSDGSDVRRLGDDAPLTAALGLLGMPSRAAYYGLLQKGEPKPGETVVVSAAAGAVGSIVGQIAKIKGCRVVGIAGSAEKCAWLRDELGWDDAVQHNTGDLADALKRACPDGIDIYFDNVGGDIRLAVFPLLNTFARLCVCGTIADKGQDDGRDVDHLPGFMRTVLVKRLTIRGFVSADFGSDDTTFRADMLRWLGEGRLKYREDVVDGLESAPRAFAGMFRGENFGKLLVHVSDPDGDTR